MRTIEATRAAPHSSTHLWISGVHENKPPSEEWINSPYRAREAQGY